VDPVPGPSRDLILDPTTIPPQKQSPPQTVSQTSPIQARIANPAIPFSGSTGNGVHAHGKYHNLRFFSKTGQKQGHLNLQNSGPVWAACFRRGWNTWQGERKALLPFAVFPQLYPHRHFTPDLSRGVCRRFIRLPRDIGPGLGLYRVKKVAGMDKHIRPFSDDDVNRQPRKFS
jgi:hypothetical protein